MTFSTGSVWRVAARLPRWRRAPVLAVVVVVLSAALGACASGSSPLVDPAANVSPEPDYTQVCAPSGLDDSGACLSVALDAIDAARRHEGLGPMRLPADFATLGASEQLLVVLDDERVARGLAPFAGVDATLDADASAGATKAALPADPGSAFRAVDFEWIGAVANVLDADFQWVYDDGPGSGTPGCSSKGGSGCWGDRRLVLDRFGPGPAPVLGAWLDPTGDTSAGDVGGTSLAALWGVPVRSPTLVYPWSQALAAIGRGTLVPRSAPPPHRSASGIPDPASDVVPVPDYTRSCSPSGVDVSAGCTDAVVAALDHARALEGVHPLRLPSDFASLDTAEQLFVVVDLERVDRGLDPAVGLSAALNADAARGAASADDPPDPGPAYSVSDAEWAGGSSNALDADYGWMYDDGPGSGNLDCPRAGAPGCWGHRHGILDDFGTVGTLVMGAALDPTGDDNPGDRGGTSMAVVLAVTDTPPAHYLITWAAVAASMPGPR